MQSTMIGMQSMNGFPKKIRGCQLYKIRQVFVFYESLHGKPSIVKYHATNSCILYDVLCSATSVHVHVCMCASISA